MAEPVTTATIAKKVALDLATSEDFWKIVIGILFLPMLMVTLCVAIAVYIFTNPASIITDPEIRDVAIELKDELAEEFSLYGLINPDAVNGGSDYNGELVGTASQQAICEYALSFLGVPYGTGDIPGVSMDCSFLVQTVYKQFGINLPRTCANEAQPQYGLTVPLGYENYQPGDLLFFDYDYYGSREGWVMGGVNRIDHVAIYLGNGQMVHEPTWGRVCEIANVSDWATCFQPVLVKRLVNDGEELEEGKITDE
jgi:hypothetical protein